MGLHIGVDVGGTKVLAAAVSRMQLRRIASDSFGWADTIPALLAEDRQVDTALPAGPHLVAPRPRHAEEQTAAQPPVEGRELGDRAS